MPTRSYWLDRALPPLRSRVRESTVDVVVVGGGVTGTACALALASRGAHVRLLEAGTVACGASGRNGGFALRGTAPAYDELCGSVGAEPARSLWELSERALERIAALAGETFRAVGSLRLATDAAELESLRNEAAVLERDGLDPGREEALPPPLDALFTGGVLVHSDGALDPARFVRGLAARALEAGAELVERRPVRAAECEPLGCGALVVAIDGHTSRLLPELAAAVKPVRGQVLVTEPLPRSFFPRPHYARHGFDYWQQLPDGRLLVGGRRDTSYASEETGDDGTTPYIQSQLELLAASLIGTSPAVSHRFSGCWGETPDRLPLAGRVPGRDHVWVAGGTSGHGMVLGFACGELVAAALAGEQPAELALLDPGRFAPAERAQVSPPVR